MPVDRVKRRLPIYAQPDWQPGPPNHAGLVDRRIGIPADRGGCWDSNQLPRAALGLGDLLIDATQGASGPVVVQIVWSSRRGSRQIEHLGSAGHQRLQDRRLDGFAEVMKDRAGLQVVLGHPDDAIIKIRADGAH